MSQFDDMEYIRVSEYLYKPVRVCCNTVYYGDTIYCVDVTGSTGVTKTCALPTMQTALHFLRLLKVSGVGFVKACSLTQKVLTNCISEFDELDHGVLQVMFEEQIVSLKNNIKG
jgi:hypothetical protein